MANNVIVTMPYNREQDRRVHSGWAELTARGSKPQSSAPAPVLRAPQRTLQAHYGSTANC